MIRPLKQSGASLEALIDLFRKHDRFILMTHYNPDGDALGSMLALAEGLRFMGKRTDMYYGGEMPTVYEFLPGADGGVRPPSDPEQYDVAVMLDCHALDRVGELAPAMSGVPVQVVLDHHLTRGELPQKAVIDTTVSSTGELVLHLLLALGLELTADMAVNLYVAIATDTGMFAYDNTTPGSLEAASLLVEKGARPWEVFQRLYLGRSAGRLRLLGMALEGLEFYYEGKLGLLAVTPGMLDAAGATSEDTDGFVEYPRSVAGVELAMFFKDNGKGLVKVSLRSLGRANAAELAQSFGGGGHFQAAGFTAEGPLGDLKARVLRAAAAVLPGGDGVAP